MPTRVSFPPVKQLAAERRRNAAALAFLPAAPTCAQIYGRELKFHAIVSRIPAKVLRRTVLSPPLPPRAPSARGFPDSAWPRGNRRNRGALFEDNCDREAKRAGAKLLETCRIERESRALRVEDASGSRVEFPRHSKRE